MDVTRRQGATPCKARATRQPGQIAVSALGVPERGVERAAPFSQCVSQRGAPNGRIVDHASRLTGSVKPHLADINQGVVVAAIGHNGN